ncbi:MAG TPA: hypothetical protein PLU30_12105 [Verrucomicrobiae bacterium]|nr:hypothetical protein [Verrucomicrobiae bacterium]
MSEKGMCRRNFIAKGALGAIAAAVSPDQSGARQVMTGAPEGGATDGAGIDAATVDFRFSPAQWQTAICFPDDPHKSLVGERGELRLSGKPLQWPYAPHPEQVEFTCLGMEADVVCEQKIEGPAIPIIHTRIERPDAEIHLIAFASMRPPEGRVDNVIMEISPRGDAPIRVVPVVVVRAAAKVNTRKAKDGHVEVMIEREGRAVPFLVCDRGPADAWQRQGRESTGLAIHQAFRSGEATKAKPMRVLFRLPKEGQPFERLKAGLGEPEALLEGARAFWRARRPSGDPVRWSLPGRHGEFLTACSRNILQAREEKGGRLTFQVGPTCYRGLWVVDGNFLLEAARYLGFDREVQQGLEATWACQQEDGAVVAAVKQGHWKDTGIAIFSLVRQAELSGDWDYFRKMHPNVLRAVRYLDGLRQRARDEGSANGKYGLLARGFCDGGVASWRSEFTNTLWVLAGLKAFVGAAKRLGMEGVDEASKLYAELGEASVVAMRAEMRRHPGGFDYLPMVMREDPQWEDPDPWERFQPQAAQWALSHAIYPGLVFDRDDPVVKGHIALMRAVTREDIPAETGWIPHEGVWTYNAAFVAHVYLWAGMPDLARRTFVGFLNHASPLYCWREEQPLRGSMVSRYVGDMPHNWASAMCVLYLRHMLAFEAGDELRLLAGIGEPELAVREPWMVEASPTRFGRVSIALEPDGKRGWRLRFRRGEGPAPARVTLPSRLGRLPFASADGAETRATAGEVEITSESKQWTASWEIK